MADTRRQVHCQQHGSQAETFVCQHIASSLHSGRAVGFHWPASSTEPRPDAWCSACEEARVRAGGEWTDEVNALLGVKLLCGACYDAAKRIWQRGEGSRHYAF
jgi:hypothetical protein